MFKEWNERRRDAYNLNRRHINVIHTVRRGEDELLTLAGRDALEHEMPFRIQKRARLGDGVRFLTVCGEIQHFRRHTRDDLDGVLQVKRGNPRSQSRIYLDARRRYHLTRIRVGDVIPQSLAKQFRFGILRHAEHLAIGSFDEAKVIDPSIGSETSNQTDIRSFGGLDGADAPVVAMMHVAHIETSALAAQPTRTQSRKGALVREAR